MSSAFIKVAIEEHDKRVKDECYRTDIRMWAKDKLGFHLWNKQVEVANALIKHRRVAVKSGHGVGKSFVASVIVAWFVDTRKDMDALAVSTAPTQPQLGIIWEYVRGHHTKGKLFGRITLDNEWKSDADVLRGMGRKPSNTNEHAFQGQHRRNGVLAVIDEACGIPESLFTGVDAITTGKYDFALAIGNPDDINTPFGKIWTSNDDSWHKMTISSYDSPNLTGEYFPEDARGGLVSPEWIESRKKAWGEDSPRFRSKVLGEFSEGATNTLFTLGTILKGHSTELVPSQESVPRLGVDVARFGEDDTSVYVYHDGVVRKVGQWSKTDLVTTAEKIHAIAIEQGAKEVRVDGVGIGAGAIDNLVRLAMGEYQVISMIGNSASPDLNKWFNARAYWWDTVRERMFNNEIDIDIEDKQLSEELGDVQYHFKNPRGSLQLEKKDDIRLRTDKSPDFADAMIYACTDLGFDPNDPVNALTPGDEFEVDVEALLWDMITEIGPM